MGAVRTVKKDRAKLYKITLRANLYKVMHRTQLYKITYIQRTTPSTIYYILSIPEFLFLVEEYIQTQNLLQIHNSNNLNVFYAPLFHIFILIYYIIYY